MIPSHRTTSPPIGLGLYLPAFDGAPYLATRLEPDLYHLLLLPARWPLYSQLNVAFRQAEANRLPTHFLMTADSCLWLQPNGGVVPARAEPRDVGVTFGKIQPCETLPLDMESIDRAASLREFLRAQGDRVIGCDPNRGGWAPSDAEAEKLGGPLRDGVPPGLERCEECGEWRGECLDPGRIAEPLVLPVACTCENDNRCARCDELLFERALQCNWYDEDDGSLRYVPGFHALDHACDG
jgi:hypothetical protein